MNKKIFLLTSLLMTLAVSFVSVVYAEHKVSCNGREGLLVYGHSATGVESVFCCIQNRYGLVVANFYFNPKCISDVANLLNQCKQNGGGGGEKKFLPGGMRINQQSSGVNSNQQCSDVGSVFWGGSSKRGLFGGAW